MGSYVPTTHCLYIIIVMFVSTTHCLYIIIVMFVSTTHCLYIIIVMFVSTTHCLYIIIVMFVSTTHCLYIIIVMFVSIQFFNTKLMFCDHESTQSYSRAISSPIVTSCTYYTLHIIQSLVLHIIHYILYSH